MKRFLIAVAASFMCAMSFAANINVTTPAKGTAAAPTLVGASTSISFSLTAMVNVAKINITVRRQSDNSIFLQQNDALRVTPNRRNFSADGVSSLGNMGRSLG